MKPVYIFIALLLSVLAFGSKSYSQDNISIPDAPYLGQKPPGLTPDGKYLFFNRNVGPDNTDTFWVDAKVIEDLRPRA